MGESLNPTVLSRVSRAIRPDFARTALARRSAAGLLVILAGVSAWWPDPNIVGHQVVVAVGDLAAGITVTAGDVALITRPAGTLPDGVLTSLDAAVGATLAGSTRRGEILTDTRVLGSRLTGLGTGPNTQMVPVRLTDGAVLDLIRPGDVVDVLGAPPADSSAGPRLLAAGAVVVLVSPAGAGVGGRDDRVVLVALPAGAAHTVAGATLVQEVTLTIH